MRDRSKQGLSLSEEKFLGNGSGWKALDYKVIVKKDKVEEKTAGGIVVPKEARDREEWTVDTAIIIDYGHLAFTEGYKSGKLVDWEPKPQPGDRVMLKEYAGMRFIGKDGEPYTVVTDKDIVGVRDE